MNDLVIDVQGLGKQYRIGAKQERHDTFRDAFTSGLRNLFRRNLNPGGTEAFWAVKDVNFQVRQGEVLGIIGRNGAGKSTMLKLLSRITSPTEGEIRVKGRVGTLLEVGTGFHPELSGRENIYLNGAILGMKRKEIDAKFDEIVAFSEIEQFIDTPVKRYSSGMYIRLAFSVAAHLEPDILLVDEVLAVGDVAFQRKCLGKMEDVAGEGRTVVFVSHNMAAVRNLCTRVMWLEQGHTQEIGDTDEVIASYLKANSGTEEQAGERFFPSELVLADHPLQVRALRTSNSAGESQHRFLSGEPIVVELDIVVEDDFPNLVVGFEVLNQYDQVIFRSFHNDQVDVLAGQTGAIRLQAHIPPNLLNQGYYRINPWIKTVGGGLIISREFYQGVAIEVVFGAADTRLTYRQGVIVPLLTWSQVPVADKELCYDS